MFLCTGCVTVNKHVFQEGGDLEKQKLRQTLKAREWDELMSSKKKMKVLEPVVRGCTWEGDGPGLEVFQLYAVCMVEPLPKADNSPSPEELSRKSQRDAQCKCVSYSFIWINVGIQIYFGTIDGNLTIKFTLL